MAKYLRNYQDEIEFSENETGVITYTGKSYTYDEEIKVEVDKETGEPIMFYSDMDMPYSVIGPEAGVKDGDWMFFSPLYVTPVNNASRPETSDASESSVLLGAAGGNRPIGYSGHFVTPQESGTTTSSGANVEYRVFSDTSGNNMYVITGKEVNGAMVRFSDQDGSFISQYWQGSFLFYPSLVALQGGSDYLPGRIFHFEHRVKSNSSVSYVTSVIPGVATAGEKVYYNPVSFKSVRVRIGYVETLVYGASRPETRNADGDPILGKASTHSFFRLLNETVYTNENVSIETLLGPLSGRTVEGMNFMDWYFANNDEMLNTTDNVWMVFFDPSKIICNENMAGIKSGLANGEDVNKTNPYDYPKPFTMYDFQNEKFNVPEGRGVLTILVVFDDGE